MDNFDHDIEQCIHVLRNGGIILYPTDTIWGIGCDANDEDAVNKIILLKERSESKSMIILVDDLQKVSNYTNEDVIQIFPMIENAAKPTTVIYSNGKNVAPKIIAADGSIGIRIVQDTFCRFLIKAFGKAIVSTSANLTGNQSPSCFDEIDEKIKMNVDYIVQHRQKERGMKSASRIVRWESDGSITTLRS